MTEKTMVTSKNILYVTSTRNNEGALLHSDLVDIVESTKYRYKHRWKRGDLVMWDNRCLMHRAIPYDINKFRRVFRRTTVAGNGAIKGPFLDPIKLRV